MVSSYLFLYILSIRPTVDHKFLKSIKTSVTGFVIRPFQQKEIIPRFHKKLLRGAGKIEYRDAHRRASPLLKIVHYYSDVLSLPLVITSWIPSVG